MSLCQLSEKSAGPARKRLIMIMGVQRSGTTALFEALAAAPGVTPRQESSGDEVYDDYFLRPESEIRSVLHALPGTVLLKPVRESERRTPLEVAAEYLNYDLRIIWLYRDPVNVFHSYTRMGWCADSADAASWFAAQWAKRNGQALAAATQLKKQLIFVSYEDLTSVPNLTAALAKVLGIQSRTPLRPDSSGGRKFLPPDSRKIIDEHTSLVRTTLERVRSIRPRRKSLLKLRFFEKLQKWRCALIGQGNKRAPATTILCSAEYAGFLSAPDLGPLYQRWRKLGVLRRSAETGSYTAIGYEACRIIHANSIPFTRKEPFVWEAPGRIADLEAWLAKRRHEFRRQIEDEVRATLSMADPYDLSSCLAKLSTRLAGVWLGLPKNDTESCAGVLQDVSLSAEGSAIAKQGEAVQTTSEGKGLVSGLLASGLLQPGEVADLCRETCLPLKALQLIVENTLVSLMDQSEIMRRVRIHPKLVRSAIHESLRLNPIFLSMKRRLIRSVELDGVVLPQNSEVDLLAGAANRDPEIFADADAFVLDRKTPPPFLLENESVPFMRLEDEARPGCNHLVLDAARIVIEHLLADSRDLRVEKGCYTKFQLPDGNCIQALTAARVTFGNESKVSAILRSP